jgi:glycosyltransferase involved in cell wall biosynthesis
MNDAKTLKAHINVIRLAWLLRSDLRQGRATHEICDDAICWWAIYGRHDYPNSTQNDSLISLELITPLPNWPKYGRFGMTRLLTYLMSSRRDLQDAFDVSTDHGLWNAIAWQFAHGLKEYGLTDQVDMDTRDALNETTPFFDSREECGMIDCPSVTWIMFFVWRCDTKLQSTYDLQREKDRASYINWFFSQGVSDLNLFLLISFRWRKWLIVNLTNPKVPNVVLPRIAMIMWLHREDLQLAFDISTSAGWVEFSKWAESAWLNEPAMMWLESKQSKTELTGISSHASQRPFGINLIGFAFGELGIGEDVRMAVAACEAAAIPFNIVNINPGCELRQGDKILEPQIVESKEDAPYAINLFCLTGFDSARVYLERGLTLFKGRYNIGWWPWELPVWPIEWQIAFDLIDEVWAASEFTMKMYSKAQLSCPVILMPMAASVSRALPVSRKKLLLPQGKFLFLYVFDFNSYLDRKNPIAVIKAFQRAFPTTDISVGLVFKTMNSKSENLNWQTFLKECAKDQRIVVIDKTLDRGEVLGIINACDAYISLHRSEGFGRTLAEAMLFGKPVIGTNFSGNVDFLKPAYGFPVQWKRRRVIPGEYPFISESDLAWWAEPNITDASRQMKLARFANLDKLYAQRVKQYAEKQFSPARIGKLITQRLHAIVSLRLKASS